MLGVRGSEPVCGGECSKMKACCSPFEEDGKGTAFACRISMCDSEQTDGEKQPDWMLRQRVGWCVGDSGGALGRR